MYTTPLKKAIGYRLTALKTERETLRLQFHSPDGRSALEFAIVNSVEEGSTDWSEPRETHEHETAREHLANALQILGAETVFEELDRRALLDAIARMKKALARLDMEHTARESVMFEITRKTEAIYALASDAPITRVVPVSGPCPNALGPNHWCERCDGKPVDRNESQPDSDATLRHIAQLARALSSLAEDR